MRIGLFLRTGHVKLSEWRPENRPSDGCQRHPWVHRTRHDGQPKQSNVYGSGHRPNVERRGAGSKRNVSAKSSICERCDRHAHQLRLRQHGGVFELIRYCGYASTGCGGREFRGGLRNRDRCARHGKRNDPSYNEHHQRDRHLYGFSGRAVLREQRRYELRWLGRR